MKVSVPPTYTLNFPETIQCIEICSSEFATSLCALAADRKIILGYIRLPVRNNLKKEFILV